MCTRLLCFICIFWAYTAHIWPKWHEKYDKRENDGRTKGARANDVFCEKKERKIFEKLIAMLKFSFWVLDWEMLVRNFIPITFCSGFFLIFNLDLQFCLCRLRSCSSYFAVIFFFASCLFCFQLIVLLYFFCILCCVRARFFAHCSGGALE